MVASLSVLEKRFISKGKKKKSRHIRTEPRASLLNHIYHSESDNSLTTCTQSPGKYFTDTIYLSEAVKVKLINIRLRQHLLHFVAVSTHPFTVTKKQKRKSTFGELEAVFFPPHSQPVYIIVSVNFFLFHISDR